jgi:hypothetical protein
LKDDIWKAYLDCVRESVVIQEQQRFEQILQQTVILTPFEIAKKEIEKRILPSCPKCKAVVADHDACSALVCGRQSDGTVMGGCSALLCGWCFRICPKDDHSSHVAYCMHNPRPGEVFRESLEVWKGVQNKLARERVLSFLSTCPRGLTSEILAMLAKEHPQLKLQPAAANTPADTTLHSHSTAITVGPQLRALPIPRQGTFIDNVNQLMAMDIATRSRAEHVLESTLNDLQAAIDLLLAANSKSK